MAKIPLSIDKNYCSDWNVWHGVRELLQNAKDAEEYDEHPMTVNHYPRTDRLEIITHNVQVNSAALLVLGKTSKGDGRQRGKFGEGFVLGVLALVRAGCEVKFRNHELSWSVSFEAPDSNHPLAGNELLTFTSRQLPAREPDFKVEITGISEEAWKIIKKMVLFLDEPKAAEVVKTDQGTVLLNPDYKHKVYVRGLFVRSFEDLECGYDLSYVQLDRDRRLIDEWQLQSQLGQIWNAACRTNPDELQPKIYEMAKAGTPETKHLKFYGDKKLLDSMKTRFEGEFGADAVPVTTSVEAKEAEKAGAKPAMVSTALKEILEGVGVSIDAVKNKLEGTITRRWAPADLSGGPEGDDEAYLKSCRLEEMLPHIAIVTFAGETPACRLIEDKKIIGVDRRLLDQPFRDVLSAAISAEAQRTGQSPYETVLGLITESEEKLRLLLEHKAMAERPVHPDECNECHNIIRPSNTSNVNKDHDESCSLYPDVS